MKAGNNYLNQPGYSVLKIGLVFLFLSSHFVPSVFGGTTQDAMGHGKFAITGSEYYQATTFDNGIIRVFLRNTGNVPVGIENCKLERIITASNRSHVKQENLTVGCTFFRLNPGEILPGQTGELLIRPNCRLLPGYPLRCSIVTSLGHRISTDVMIQKPELKIDYVAFSEDLSKIYIYAKNCSDRSMWVKLEEVNGYAIESTGGEIEGELLPDEDTCFVFSFEPTLTKGQYVHILVSGKSLNSTVVANAIVRAFGQFPLSWTKGTEVNSQLGLGSYGAHSGPATEASCVYGLECVSHSHGTVSEAANKFNRIRQAIINQNPKKLVNILFCWPGTDLHKFAPFFQLPDLPVINTCKLTYTNDSTAPHDYFTSFHPYYWRARQSLNMSSPHPFAAVIPVGPNARKSGFDISLPSTDYIRFMTYCAIAGGAKGIYYMMTSEEIEDPMRRQQFAMLNKELQSLSPLLTISHPVNLIGTNSTDISAIVLRCGNEALLVILLNRTHPGIPSTSNPSLLAHAQQSNLVRLEVPVPKGLTCVKVRDFYGPVASAKWSSETSQVAVSYRMVESATVLKIELDCANKRYPQK